MVKIITITPLCLFIIYYSIIFHTINVLTESWTQHFFKNVFSLHCTNITVIFNNVLYLLMVLNFDLILFRTLEN